MLAKLNRNPIALTVMALYAVELLDELIYGLFGATLPLLKNDFVLDYLQVGLLTTIPGVVSLALEPFIGVLGDTRFRRALVRGGILATMFGLALVAFGQTYALILIAFCLLYVASGAYVNLAQATLMDRNAARTEHTMARWTLLGSIGVTLAPLATALALGAGYGWRNLYLAFAGAAGVYVVLLWRIRFDAHDGADMEQIAPRQMLRDLFAALRNRELLRWVILTELADLMLDKLYEVTALYFHDVAGVDFAPAALASSVFAVAGLLGGFMMIPILERVRGVRVLRVSALLVALLYSAFLLTPLVWTKYALIALVSFATAGWFAILRGRTYAALPGQSGMVVAVTALANVSVLFVPTVLGALADAWGLQIAMWLLLLGPLALLVGLPRTPTAK
jgi:FSR family fosmidomycin resistance protein-like MFS transporter